jgi:hypothetical protein
MLPAETFQMRRHLSPLPLAKLRQIAKAFLEKKELSIYGDTHH